MAVIANGEGQRIRDLIADPRVPDDKLQADITATIGELMISYCGATEDGTHIGIFRTCAELMAHKFSEMSIGEIREAFRLAAVNEIDANLIAYKGVANAVMFGNLMAAYKEHRRKYVAEIVKQQEIEQREKMQSEGHLQRKMQYEAMVVDWFENALKTKGANIKGYNQIPVYYYNTLDELNKLNIPNKTKEIYLQLAIEQYAEMLKAKENVEKSDRRFISTLMEDGFSEGLANVEKDKKLDVTNLAKRLLLHAIIKGDVKHIDRGITILKSDSPLPLQE